jgi:hypothetical protein
LLKFVEFFIVTPDPFIEIFDLPVLVGDGVGEGLVFEGVLLVAGLELELGLLVLEDFGLLHFVLLEELLFILIVFL